MVRVMRHRGVHGTSPAPRYIASSLVTLLFEGGAITVCGGCSGEPYKWIVDARPTVLFTEETGDLCQVAEARIAYWLRKSKTFSARVEVESLSDHRFVSTDIGPVSFGDHDKYRIKVPDINEPTRMAFRLFSISDGRPGEFQNEITKDWVPQRKWTVFLIPSSHIDIYGTGNADVTPEQHRQMLDSVCELCERYPEYVYQIENRLPVYEYLDGHRSPEQVNRLIDFIREGRIAFGAQFTGVHQGETSGESYIQGQLVPWNQGIDLDERYGIRPSFCAIFDTPGVMKQLPEFLSKAGIRYAVYAPNASYHIPETLGVPYIYYLESESGSRVLAWRSSYGYNAEKENYFKLTNPDFVTQEDSVNEKLLQRESSLDENGKPNPDLDYPYDHYAVLWDYGDNKPADAGPLEFAGRWNSRWAYPRFQVGSYEEFFSTMESSFGDRIPHRRGELANPWEYVVMNQGVINLYDRYSQRTLGSAQKWWTVFDLLGGDRYPRKSLQKAWDNLAKLEAHDWFYGAKLDPETGELVPDYMKPDWAKAEWSLIAEEISRCCQQKGLSKLASEIDCRGVDKIVIFNPLSFDRTDPVVMKAPRRLEIGKFMLRDDASSEEVPYQLISAWAYQDSFGRRPVMKNQDKHFRGKYPDPPPPSGKYIMFVAEQVPGMGYKTYSVVPVDKRPVFPNELVVKEDSIVNQYYRVRMDPESGLITSAFDKELNKELVDTHAEVCGKRTYFNQFLKGTPSLDSAGILINIPPFSDRPRIWQPVLDAVTRRSVKRWRSDFAGKVEVGQSGPVMASLVVTGRDRLLGKRRQAVTLYSGIKRIDFVNWVEKAGYIPFQRYAISYPLEMGGEFSTRYHSPHSVCEVGADELAGGSSPHRHLGDWIEFRGTGHRVSISSPDVGPFALGRPDLNLIDDASHKPPGNPYYFPVYLDTCSWSAFVVPGSYALRFSLSSTPATTEVEWAHRFGSSFAYPLEGRVVNEQGGRLEDARMSIFSVDRTNVDIAAVKKPNRGDGVVLRLSETAGKNTQLTLSLNDMIICTEACLTGLDEEPMSSLPHSNSQVFLELKPYEVATVRLDIRNSNWE